MDDEIKEKVWKAYEEKIGDRVAETTTQVDFLVKIAIETTIKSIQDEAGKAMLKSFKDGEFEILVPDSWGKRRQEQVKLNTAYEIFDKLKRSLVSFKDVEDITTIDKERALFIYKDSVEFIRKGVGLPPDTEVSGIQPDDVKSQERGTELPRME